MAKTLLGNDLNDALRKQTLTLGQLRSAVAVKLSTTASRLKDRPNSVKIKSRYFAGFCGLKHVPCMSNLLGIFVLGHYGALYTQNDENDVIFF